MNTTKIKYTMMLGCVSVLLLGAGAIDDLKAQEGNIPKAPTFTNNGENVIFCKELCSQQPYEYVAATALHVASYFAEPIINGNQFEDSFLKTLQEFRRQCTDVPCPVAANMQVLPAAQVFLNKDAISKLGANLKMAQTPDKK